MLWASMSAQYPVYFAESGDAEFALAGVAWRMYKQQK